MHNNAKPVLYFILAVLSTAFLTACSLEKEPADPLDHMISLLEKDKSGDKRTVYWDGTKAYTMKDPEDDPNINYSEEMSLERYEADHLIGFDYLTGYEFTDIDEAHPNKCHLVEKGNETTQHEAFITPIDYEQAVSEMDADSQYRETEDFPIADFQTRYFEKSKAYIGLKDFDGIKKAGFVFLFQSNLSNASYKIETYGLGAVLGIRRDARIIIDHFDVVFYDEAQ